MYIYSFYKHAVSVRMGSPILLESCRMADAAKNNPGQWKFIGIEGMYQKGLLNFIIIIYYLYIHVHYAI